MTFEGSKLLVVGLRQRGLEVDERRVLLEAVEVVEVVAALAVGMVARDAVQLLDEPLPPFLGIGDGHERVEHQRVVVVQRQRGDVERQTVEKQVAELAHGHGAFLLRQLAGLAGCTLFERLLTTREQWQQKSQKQILFHVVFFDNVVY